MDLIIAFVPYLSCESLCVLFELVKALLEVQKKYRVIFIVLQYYSSEVVVHINV